MLCSYHHTLGVKCCVEHLTLWESMPSRVPPIGHLKMKRKYWRRVVGCPWTLAIAPTKCSESKRSTPASPLQCLAQRVHATMPPVRDNEVICSVEREDIIAPCCIWYLVRVALPTPPNGFPTPQLPVQGHCDLNLAYILLLLRPCSASPTSPYTTHSPPSLPPLPWSPQHRSRHS